MNAVRGVPTAQKQYEMKKRDADDVTFDLVEIDHVLFGQPFSVTVHIHVRCIYIFTLALSDVKSSKIWLYQFFILIVLMLILFKHNLSC